MWSNGEKYEGFWLKDLREGKGIMHWPNGDKYNGFWKEDKMSGKGVFI